MHGNVHTLPYIYIPWSQVRACMYVFASPYADIDNNSFTDHSLCARHYAKCLVNIASPKC